VSEVGGESLHLALDTRENARQRLRSIRGHVEGLLRMLDDESTYCVDILKQVKAVNGALDKVADVVLRSHLQDHVVTAAARGDTGLIVEELMEVLKYR
jgi:CsoR family transcriptional regulator, copper-sensing transcriptional repressor